jgi:meso-butanediol dehydrogenase / (S,S)-butanediol dehydrogenase / diacetyl reductase
VSAIERMMSRRLEGKVALITGTGGGQGRAGAIRFAQEGAHVVGCDLLKEGNDETVAAVRAAGGSMTGMGPVDLGDPEAARAWVESAAALHGRIDVVYNNASAPAAVAMPDGSIENWRSTIRNELDLVFYVTKFAWPYLAKRGGVIINTASTSAYVSSRAPGALAHCAAKGGVLAMTRAFATDGASAGIRAVSISPGPIKTPGAIKAFFHIPGAEEATIKQLLVNRVGTSEDVAALAVFLASDEAGFITGTDIVIDGGMTAL